MGKNLKALLPVILFLQIAPVIGFTYDFQNLVKSEEYDSTYLSYSLIIDREQYIEPDCSYPEHRMFMVARTVTGDETDGLIIFANNPSPNSSRVSLFMPKSYPEFRTTDDDPIKYTITSWNLFKEPTTGDPLIIGLCHNSDSLFLFTLNEETDETRYKLIYANNTGRKFVPLANVRFFSDLDNDGHIEIIFSYEFPRQIRKLCSYNYDDLDKNWELDLSSGINYIYVTTGPDSLSEMILVTRNAANGIRDDQFDDRLSYLTRINMRGEVVYNRIVGLYQKLVPVLIRSEIPDQFFMIHYLDIESADSTDGKNADQYFISRVDKNCNTLNRIAVKSSPVDLYLIYDKDNIPYLFVLFRSKEVAVYNMALKPVEKLGPLVNTLIFFQKVKLAAMDDSAYVMEDGIYGPAFNKVLQFPFMIDQFAPLRYDLSGNTISFIIHESNHFYIGNIKYKSAFDLISVFYHNNEKYVLIIVTSLLVGLFVVGIYQRKADKNLKIITRQKKELEITHESLRKAQETIIAQEKFQQAKNIAGGFAHEMRNSLFPAKSAISKMNELPDNEKVDLSYVRKLNQYIDRSVNRAINLTEAISKYTKIESSANKEKIYPRMIIEDAIKSNKLTLDDKGIKTTVEGEDEISITGNTEQFYIVFNNLLLNAVDALEGIVDPSISVSIRSDKEMAEIVFSDNGCGIGPEDSDKIFEIFYSTKPTKGIGIGLSTVRKILDLYDCKIDFESALNKGTSFIISCQCNQD